MTGKADEHLKELITIRKLLVLALLRSGMTQAQIGAALGVHRTQIARMFPAGALHDSAKKKGALKPDTAEVGE
jgi:Homeodomain-like domain-containing protein